MQSKADVVVQLGHTQLSGKELVNLRRGDVVRLDQYATDAFDIFVEGVLKYKGYPGIYKGNQAVQIAELIKGKEGDNHGAE